jgi:Domain of unknown function (DUF4331)
MRRIIGTIGATLAIVGVMATFTNWIPLQNPAGGPYFGKLDPDARYYAVKIDNTGDGVEDVAYRWNPYSRWRTP